MNGNVYETQNGKLSKSEPNGIQKCSSSLPTLLHIFLKKSYYLLSWKSLSGIKFRSWTIVQVEFKSTTKPLFISLNERSHIIFTLGFHDEMILNSWRSKYKMKVLGKSFYSLSFNFQKVSISTQFHTTNKQTIKQTQLFI